MTASVDHGGEEHRMAGAWDGAGLRAVIAGARRRAHRDAERQIDTAHLLHALLESDPRACEALGRAATGAAGRDAALRVARVLAYLAQRGIGYGLRWRHTVEGAAARPPALGGIGFSPRAVAALAEAAGRAAARGGDPIEGVDLLAALAADRDARAVEVLRAARVDPARLVEHLTPDPAELVECRAPDPAELVEYRAPGLAGLVEHFTPDPAELVECRASEPAELVEQPAPDPAAGAEGGPVG